MMFNQRFTVAGSSLKLLQVGERGVVANFKTQDEVILRKLRTLGINPGTSVILEQRFPRFLIKVGTQCVALDEEMISAVYVRLLDQRTGLTRGEQCSPSTPRRVDTSPKVGAWATSQS